MPASSTKYMVFRSELGYVFATPLHNVKIAEKMLGEFETWDEAYGCVYQNASEEQKSKFGLKP